MGLLEFNEKEKKEIIEHVGTLKTSKKSGWFWFTNSLILFILCINLLNIVIFGNILYKIGFNKLI